MSTPRPPKPPSAASYDVQMTFRIPSVLANKIKSEAKRIHTKPSEILRRIIFAHVEALGTAKPAKKA